MSVEFNCPACGRALRVGDEFAGKQARCPGCRQVMTVPAQQAASAPAGRPENAGPTPEASPHREPAAAGTRPRRLTWLWIAGAGVVAAGLLAVLVVTLARSSGPSPGDAGGTAAPGPVAKTPAPTATPPERAQPATGPATTKPKPPMKPGSTDKPRGPLPRGRGKNDAGPSFGQSFNIIEEVSGNGYMIDGYESYVAGQSGAFAPNAVLIVGVKDGVELGGQAFDYGCIIIVEGTTAVPTFRLARPDDRIVLSVEVTVFGKKHGKGTFEVPAGGKVTPSEE